MAALYRCRAARSEIENLFGCTVAKDLQWGSSQWPGEQALIVRQAGRGRIAELMHWGMPAPAGSRRRLQWTENSLFGPLAFQQKKDRPERCLIPLDSFALPDGKRGARTRSWFGLWDEPIFARAGFWRDVEGFGPSFCGATIWANSLVARVGPRMPLILKPTDHTVWLRGRFSDLRQLWRSRYLADAFWMERTDERWGSGRSATEHFIEKSRC